MISKFFLIPSSISLKIPLSLINLGSSVNGEIVLATYQSYIKDEIAAKAYDEFSLKTIYFENDKEVFNGFASGAFDLAIVSSSTLEEAVTKGLVKKINWGKFSDIAEKIKKDSRKKRSTENTAKESEHDFSKLYSPVVNRFFTNSASIRDYGIPYFLSYFMFAYRGAELKPAFNNSAENNLVNANGENRGIKSWSELIKAVSQDARFKPDKGLPKLGLVEDELTILSFSKLSSDTNNASSQETLVNGTSQVEELFKQEEKIQTAEEIYRQFQKLSLAGLSSSSMGVNSLLLNPDSMVLSEMLAKEELMGVFTYNGDALATLDLIDKKSDEKEEETQSENGKGDNWPEENYEEMGYTPVLNSLQEKIKKSLLEEGGHNGENNSLNFWVGNPYLWFLDSIAISARVSPEKEDKIYKFLEKLSFTGMEVKNGGVASSGRESSQSDGDNQATKSLKYELLFGKKEFEQCLRSNNTSEVSSPKSTSSSIETKTENSNSQGKCPIVFERGFQDAQNLNLSLAFQKWKQNY